MGSDISTALQNLSVRQHSEHGTFSIRKEELFTGRSDFG